MMSESNYIMNESSVSDSSKSDNNNSEETYCDAGLIHDVIDSTDVISKTFKEQLKKWACEYNITHRATGALLKLLKNVKDINELEDLPLDPRTLLSTPKHIVVRDVPPGKYFHYGLENALTDILKSVHLNTVPNNIEININIDGLPLTKSSKSQFYPILGEIYPRISELFVIGVYHRYSKPACPNIFLKDFIEEYISLHEKGFQFNGIHFTVTIRCVVCDSPAAAFVKCIKAFNGYFGCAKCMQEGDYNNHRMLFLEINANLRTDENFVYQQNKEHHIGRSIFEKANLGIVSQFPLDYMHLVCLGVVKKCFIFLCMEKLTH